MLRVAILWLALCAVSVAAWKRTQCGPGNLVTSWGAQVNPNSVLPEYPRPQMTRGSSSWINLNGLWQFQPGAANQSPPFNRTLSTQILVPFPVESCLSGIGQNYQYLWYRQLFNVSSSFLSGSSRLLLHFGAVDWQTNVYINGKLLGTHEGGYDGFSFDITANVQHYNNELIVGVYDPSDLGSQPNGKQRISAITNPGGDTYTPSSGIWQTVWLEAVPQTYIESLTILTDTRTLTVSAAVQPASTSLSVLFLVFENTTLVAKASSKAGVPVTIQFANPHMWSPSDPYLYTLTVSLSDQSDTVGSYFGLRSFELADVVHPGRADTGPQQGVDRAGGDLPGFPVTLPSADPTLCWNMCKNNSQCVAWAYAVPGCDSYKSPMCWLKGVNEPTSTNQCRVSGSLATNSTVVKRPYLNGGFLFLTGWLDQSFWPDGLYTAPSDEALRFDLEVVASYGLNVVRLHQKVNPERWYYWADLLGIIVFQDAVQKYGGATPATVAPFTHDITAMIAGRYNHPCIVQWTVFNEEDCWAQFNVSEMVNLVRNMDPSRLTDTDSGGGANSLYIGDVNDIHTYPYPGDPAPSFSQYGMIGEFGGLGAFISGHMWVPNQCQTYLQVNGSQSLADTYIGMLQTIQSNKDDISAVIYTQITDVERECDGFMNYDRTPKFTAAQQTAVMNANIELIEA